MLHALRSVPTIKAVDAAAYSALEGFTCGGGSEYELEVDDILRSYAHGHSPTWLTVIVAEDPDADHALVGACGVHQRALPRVDPGTMYVGVIGVTEDYRGRRLPDGETRIGDFLLHRALLQQERTWGVSQSMWAMIHKANVASQALFHRAGFQRIALVLNPADDIWLRPRGLAVPAQPPTSG